MFKELGEFIDNVGRATGRMIGQILSDKDDDDIDGMMGYPAPDPDDDHRITVSNIDIDDTDINVIKSRSFHQSCIFCL